LFYAIWQYNATESQGLRLKPIERCCRS
jgi:hypothetical protein